MRCPSAHPDPAAIPMNSSPPIPARRLVYLKDLSWTLVDRDMKVRYKRSVLGITWSLLNPLLQLLVLYFVFRVVLPLGIPNYVVFLFTGILVWNWFQSSLQFACGAIADNSALIGQPGFPAAILPVVTVTTHLIHFLLALPILLVFLAVEGTPLTRAMLALPLLIALQFALTLGLAYLVATAHVHFRDTQYLVGVFLLLGLYLSPVFYEPDSVPARYQPVYRLNPMVHLIDSYRSILIRGELPDLTPLLVLSLLAVGLLALSYRIFLRASHRFIEEL